MNTNHVLFWEVFLSFCAVCLVIALAAHLWILRKRKRAWVAREKAGLARARKKRNRVMRTKKRKRRK